MRKKYTAKILTYRKILAKAPMYLQVADRYRKLHKDISVSEDTYIHVFAPAMIEFIRWVLYSAIKDGRKRLYFLSRDGYQMYLVARELVKLYGLDIDCRYLYVSRYALRLPEYHLIQEKCLDRICIGGIDVTFEKIMKRAGLDETEAIDVARACDFVKDYRKIMSYRQVLALKEVLRKKGIFFEYVYTHSLKKYGATISYLKQEGLFDSVSYAIVDSGWVGTLHQSLNNLLISGGKKGNIHGYYFGLYETPKGYRELYKAYYFEPERGILNKVNFSNCLFEAVYTSPDGMTSGYEKKADRVIPIFETDKNSNKEFIEGNVNCLMEYLGLYSEIIKACAKMKKKENNSVHNAIFCSEKKFYDEKKSREVTGRLFKELMGKPSSEEVDIYGSILFSDDVLEGKLKMVAAQLSDKEIKNQRFVNKVLIMLGLKQGVIHESAWLEGSIVRNGRQVSKNLGHARLYKFFVYLRKMFT